MVAVVGAVPFVLGVLMNVYYLLGKRRTRDHILDLASAATKPCLTSARARG